MAEGFDNRVHLCLALRPAPLAVSAVAFVVLLVFVAGFSITTGCGFCQRPWLSPAAVDLSAKVSVVKVFNL